MLKVGVPKNITKNKNVAIEQAYDLDVKSILEIDSAIQKTLLERMVDTETLYEELEKYKMIEEMSPSSSDKIVANEKKKMLRKRLKDFEMGVKYIEYLKEVEKILEDYYKISKRQKPSYFGCEAEINQQDSDEIFKIKKRFYLIARKYIDVKMDVKEDHDSCDCGGYFIKEESTKVCSSCGLEEYYSEENHNFSFKDLNRINITPKSTYLSKQNFVLAKTKSMAKNNMIIPESVYETIRKQCSLSGYKIENITKKQLYSVLKDKKLSSYYSGLAIIHRRLTRIQPIDFSEYNKEIDEIYDIIEKTYYDIFDRENSLNVWFKLYKILRLIDVGCQKEDFCYSISEKSMDEYEELWRKIMTHLMKTDPTRKNSKGKKLWKI